mmetsp:Transcript_11256/g.30416  ORF Transcript_11256/g.30416 Transcript_11256/m.30416 type:complete len:357 (+) Transcript_11256:1045-2115(+)
MKHLDFALCRRTSPRHRHRLQGSAVGAGQHTGCTPLLHAHPRARHLLPTREPTLRAAPTRPPRARATGPGRSWGAALRRGVPAPKLRLRAPGSGRPPVPTSLRALPHPRRQAAARRDARVRSPLPRGARPALPPRSRPRRSRPRPRCCLRFPPRRCSPPAADAFEAVVCTCWIAWTQASLLEICFDAEGGYRPASCGFSPASQRPWISRAPSPWLPCRGALHVTSSPPRPSLRCAPPPPPHPRRSMQTSHPPPSPPPSRPRRWRDLQSRRRSRCTPGSGSVGLVLGRPVAPAAPAFWRHHRGLLSSWRPGATAAAPPCALPPLYALPRPLRGARAPPRRCHRCTCRCRGGTSRARG